MVDIFECHTSHPIFPATEPLSLGQSKKGRSNLPFRKYIRQQEDSHQDHIGKQFTLYLQSNLPMVWDWKLDTCIKNKRGRRANRSRTRAVDIDDAKKHQPMTQAHDDSALPKENHETMIRKASEQAVFARAVENGQFYITNEFVMNGNSCTPLCREYSEPRNSQSSRLQAVLTNHVKIGPVARIEVIKSAKYKCRHNNQEIRSLGCEYHEESKYTHYKLFLWRLTTKISKPCHHSSQRAAGDREKGGNSPVRYKAAPKRKLPSTGFSQRVQKLIPARA